MAFDLQQKVFRIPSNNTVSVGLRWDFVGVDPIDLDLSAVSFTKEGKFLDCVFFNHPLPKDTEKTAFADGSFLDPQHLPYMFVSGDSRIGGEEENHLSGLALATKRRQHLFGNEHLKRMGMLENVFSRLYEEKELDGVEEALDEYTDGKLVDEDGQPLQDGQRRNFCDELATFVMHKIPNEVDIIFLCVTSYTGADLTILPSAECLVLNETTNERVGRFDIKRTTGNGTANLVCMMCRLPSVAGEQQLWDLRELNIRTFGYTFVDVLPVMLDVLGVDSFSRDDAVRLLPDYSLAKENARYLSTHTLSHVRFGVGWSGEHDLDAFMVMFDEENRYVDHLHPKEAKHLCSHPHTARHSGDAINGFSTVGDDEFIDLITYRLRPNVSTIVFGVHYVETFGRAAGKTQSIYDIPQLYARLQNRAMNRPKSFEVDRWDVHYEKPQSSGISKIFSCKGREGHTEQARTLILGAMVRQGEVPLASLFLQGQQEQQQQQQQTQLSHADTPDILLDGIGDERIPLFEYYALHEHIPAGAADTLAAVVPYLHCVAQYRFGALSRQQPHPRVVLSNRDAAAAAAAAAARRDRPALFLPAAAAAGPLGADAAESREAALAGQAVQLQFLELRGVRPRLPQQFRCHGEAWVCDGAAVPSRPYGINDTNTFRTPFLMHQESTQWSESNAAARALFFVRKFDRIRVAIYEYATLGIADLDLMNMDELWAPELSPIPKRLGKGFNMVEMWVPLSGGELCDGEVKLRMWRVPTQKVKKEREKVINSRQKKRDKHQKKIIEERDHASRKAFSTPCTLM